MDVREYVYEELTKMSHDVIDVGGFIIIGGDFNKEDKDRSRITAMMRDLHMLTASRIHEDKIPETYIGGRKTIDHV